MIQVNLDKAKEITHEKRRDKRATELAPLDVQVTIPTMAEQVEAKRAGIRSKYAAIQTQIDAAESVDVLKDIISELQVQGTK